MTYDPDHHHRRSIRLRGYDYRLAGAYFVTIVTQDRAALFGRIVDSVMHLNDAGWMVQAVWDEIPICYPGVDIDAFVIMPNHIHGIIILTGAATRDVGADPCVRPLGDGLGVAPTDDGVGEYGQPRGVAPTDDGVGEYGQPRGVAPTDNGVGEYGQPRGVAPTDNGMGEYGQPRGVAPTLSDAPTLGDAPTPMPLSLGDIVSRFKSLTTKRYTDGVKQLEWPPYRGRVWQRNYYEHIIRNDPSLQRIRYYIETNPQQWPADRENLAAASLGQNNEIRDTRCEIRDTKDG
jgi:putative transposase